MKRKFIYLLLLFVSPLNLISQTVQWTSHLGSRDLDDGYGVASSNGEYYYLGFFRGDTLFSPVQNLNETQMGDLFFIKYDNTGAVIFQKQIYNDFLTSNCTGSGGLILLDENNSCLYLYGSMCGRLTYDSSMISSVDSDDEFLAKLDLNGNLLWLKSFYGPGGDPFTKVNQLQLDENGVIYGMSTVSSFLQFDSCHFNNGLFLFSIDTGGTCLWINKFSVSDHFIQPSRIVVHNQNMIVTARILVTDTIQIDTIVFTNITMPGMLIAKFSNTGNVLWAKILKCPTLYNAITALDVDQNDNIYFSGHFQDTLIFESTTLTTSNIAEMYFIKVDSMGNYIYSKTFNSNSQITDLKVCKEKLYITGSLTDTMTCDGNTVIPNSIGDLFIVEYDTNGTYLNSFHTNSGTTHSDLSCDSIGNIYLNVAFNGTLELGNTTLTSYGDRDICIAKLNSIVGIPDKERISNELIIYANPSTGSCRIKMPDGIKNSKNLILSVYDIAGRNVLTTNLSSQNYDYNLHLEEEPKGIYQATLSDGVHVYNGKIIFQ
jgi:hypothetical protein